MSKIDTLAPIIFAMLVTIASTASAGAVYKCTTLDGKSSFQQTPCSVDSLSPLADVATQRQEAALQAAAADYAKRIKEVEVLMENDEKLNEALQKKQ